MRRYVVDLDDSYEKLVLASGYLLMLKMFSTGEIEPHELHILNRRKKPGRQNQSESLK